VKVIEAWANEAVQYEIFPCSFFLWHAFWSPHSTTTVNYFKDCAYTNSSRLFTPPPHPKKHLTPFFLVFINEPQTTATSGQWLIPCLIRDILFRASRLHVRERKE
jgi:hypothetical protein